MISALRFSLNDNYDAILYPVGMFNTINFDKEYECDLGKDFYIYQSKTNDNNELISIATGLDGEPVLRLLETKRYILKLLSTSDIDNSKTIELPILQNESNKYLKVDRDSDSLTFQFINYLGRTKAIFPDFADKKILNFEVVPNKIDYENDYVVLTESLADKCSELLQDYAGVTSNVFSLSNDDSTTLLEQFIFMRKFCYSENLLSLFEAIKRNPDRRLVEKNEYKPLGCGRPSNKVFTHPFQYAKKWNRYSNNEGQIHYLPGLVSVTEKRDSIDTVANRFIKFALKKFQYICDKLIEYLNEPNVVKQTECLKEATQIKLMIDDILRDSFFDDIGRMEIMPQNNQVLQKRTGYLEIFAAYSMVDLALQLDWRGKDSIYEGESKDIALLYEYWLFFKLNDVIRGIDGCNAVEAETSPAISFDKHKISLSLSKGKESCLSYSINKLGLKINLYYNRIFSQREFDSAMYCGSYSKDFRPDYTISIFPDTCSSEASALRNGTVGYVHFDAKYRISNLSDSNENGNDEDDVVGNNIYKLADLYKMHTYNDAIRRTLGSFVLYPGTDDNNNIYCRYDELLPSVGAFAIKPSTEKMGNDNLNKFISNLLNSLSLAQSRLRRLNCYTEMVIKEPSAEYRCISRCNNDNRCIIGYIRAVEDSDYYFWLKNNNLFYTGKEFIFYFDAIKNGNTYAHHRDVFSIEKLKLYANDISETNSYILEPYLFEVLSNKLVSRNNLIKELKIEGYNMDMEKYSADYYYAFKVRTVKEDEEITLSVNDVDKVNGNDSYSLHIPKIINL